MRYVILACALFWCAVIGAARSEPLHTKAAPSFWSFLQPKEETRAARIHVRYSAHHRVHTGHGASPLSSDGGLGGGSIVEAARSQIGNGAIYGRSNLWCARFVNYILKITGHQGTDSDAAASFAHLPRTGMQVGAIAVMRHHVGVVSGVDASGNPVVISGNNGHRVRESVVARGRVLAFVVPQ